MNLLSNYNCSEYFIGIEYPIENSQICISTSNGNGICSGDSGGPLSCEVLKTDGSTVEVLAGVASWGGNPCGNPIPNVYTRVESFLTFIKYNKTGNNVEVASINSPFLFY